MGFEGEEREVAGWVRQAVQAQEAAKKEHRLLREKEGGLWMVEEGD